MFIVYTSVICLFISVANVVVASSQEKLVKVVDKKNPNGKTVVMNGAIVAAQFMCNAPCGSNWYLTISRTNLYNQVGVETNTMLQELLPPAPTAVREFETFTSYDETSRQFAVVAADFPKATQATLWVSTINNAVDQTTPVYTEVVVQYPDSTSPFPLNDVPLKLSRVLFVGSTDHLIAIFTNGEIHRLDLASGSFKLLARLNSDEQLLSTEYPHATWSHVFDKESKVIRSVVTGGVNAYLLQTDLATFTVSDRISLTMPKGITSGFSPETFINAHMVRENSTLPYRLMVSLESLTNVGFDEYTFVDTTTGVMGGANAGDNLMEDNILLDCSESAKTCDKWQVSAFDPETNRLFFQGHDVTSDVPTLSLYTLQFFYYEVQKQWGVVIDINMALSYGYTGFQFVPFVN